MSELRQVTTRPSLPPDVAPTFPAGGRFTTAWKGDGIGNRDFTTSSQPGPMPAVLDLVSTRLSRLPQDDLLRVGLLGRAVSARRRRVDFRLGGARASPIPQAVEGKESLWRAPPQAWGTPVIPGRGNPGMDRKTSGSSPPTGGKGPGRPRAGRATTAPTGIPAGERLGGSRGPGQQAHRVAQARRRDGSTPAERGFLQPGPPAVEAAGRRAGRRRGPRGKPRPGRSGPQAPVGGTTSESPGSGERRPRPEVGGRGAAGRGQGEHLSSQLGPLL